MKFESLRQKLQVRRSFETPEIESLLEKPDRPHYRESAAGFSQG
jgi:hypothetical protein